MSKIARKMLLAEIVWRRRSEIEPMNKDFAVLTNLFAQVPSCSLSLEPGARLRRGGGWSGDIVMDIIVTEGVDISPVREH